MGNPSMTAFAIGASDVDINIQALADVMETKGNNDVHHRFQSFHLGNAHFYPLYTGNQ